MGMKTFRYEADGPISQGRGQIQLHGRSRREGAERIGSSASRRPSASLIELETAVRFDKLGVQDAILRIEIHAGSETGSSRRSSFCPCSTAWRRTKAFCILRAKGRPHWLRASGRCRNEKAGGAFTDCACAPLLMAAQEPAPDPELQEQYELSQAMSEAGTARSTSSARSKRIWRNIPQRSIARRSNRLW